MSAAARRGRAPDVATQAKAATKDLEKFEALPEKTKVLARLQEDVDKSSGPAAVAAQKKIKAADEK